MISTKKKVHTRVLVKRPSSSVKGITKASVFIVDFKKPYCFILELWMKGLQGRIISYLQGSARARELIMDNVWREHSNVETTASIKWVLFRTFLSCTFFLNCSNIRTEKYSFKDFLGKYERGIFYLFIFFWICFHLLKNFIFVWLNYFFYFSNLIAKIIVILVRGCVFPSML